MRTNRAEQQKGADEAAQRGHQQGRACTPQELHCDAWSQSQRQPAAAQQGLYARRYMQVIAVNEMRLLHNRSADTVEKYTLNPKLKPSLKPPYSDTIKVFTSHVGI